MCNPTPLQACWRVDSLELELQRLHALGISPQTLPTLHGADTLPSATFADPFGNVVGLIEVHDPQAQRARQHRAAEKIALRKVRAALDDLGAQDLQQRSANRLVLAMVVVVLLVAAFALVNVLPKRTYEDRITIPITDKK